VEYWVQFYYAALNWKSAHKLYLDLADLIENPDVLLLALDEAGLKPGANKLALPKQYMATNSDHSALDSWNFDREKTVAEEASESRLIRTWLSDDACAAVRRATNSLYDALMAERSPAGIRTRR
jgi:hypothetical protein